MDTPDPARGEHPDPGRVAAIIVAETVVAAQPPSASATARLGRAALRTEPAGAVASASSAAASKPTNNDPSRTATVAGTAPSVSRTAASDAARHLEVLRIRQPVADERRLEGDDRPALREGRGDLGRDDEPVGHGTRDGHAQSVPPPLPCAHGSHAAR